MGAHCTSVPASFIEKNERDTLDERGERGEVFLCIATALIDHRTWIALQRLS